MNISDVEDRINELENCLHPERSIYATENEDIIKELIGYIRNLIKVVDFKTTKELEKDPEIIESKLYDYYYNFKG